MPRNMDLNLFYNSSHNEKYYCSITVALVVVNMLHNLVERRYRRHDLQLSLKIERRNQGRRSDAKFNELLSIIG